MLSKNGKFAVDEIHNFLFFDVPKDGFESEDTDVDGSEEGDIQDEQFSDNEDNFIDDCKLVY